MKRLISLALLVNAILVAGRIWQASGTAQAGVAPEPGGNGDVNCDGGLDLSDAVYLLNFLFLGTREPCAFAGSSDVETRVAALEGRVQALVALAGVHGRAVHDARSQCGAKASALASTDVTARLSEARALSAAYADLQVPAERAGEAVATMTARLGDGGRMSTIDTGRLNIVPSVAAETSAAAETLNAWIDEARATVDRVGGRLDVLSEELAAAAVAGLPFSGEQYLRLGVVANLLELQACTESEAFTRSIASLKALSAAVADLEEELSSIGDDAQLANIDLQRMLEKQQQTLQTISNVSKMLHDTAMAIIRKIG